LKALSLPIIRNGGDKTRLKSEQVGILRGFEIRLSTTVNQPLLGHLMVFCKRLAEKEGVEDEVAEEDTGYWKMSFSKSRTGNWL
jgi:hypothetical protein